MTTESVYIGTWIGVCNQCFEEAPIAVYELVMTSSHPDYPVYKPGIYAATCPACTESFDADELFGRDDRSSLIQVKQVGSRWILESECEVTEP